MIFRLLALVVLRGARFSHEAQIPVDKYRAETTTIPFFIEVPELSINLSLPRWNTHALHAPIQGNTIATTGFLRLDASHRYFAEVRKENVDLLSLNFTVCRIFYFKLRPHTLDFVPLDSRFGIQITRVVRQVLYGSTRELLWDIYPLFHFK
jgi:hypothetical protein